jgi:subtilisin family serine protease
VRRAVAGAALVAALVLPAAASAAQPPDDPLAGQQWYLARDRALDVFNAAQQLLAVRVAVIDSGIELNHPELKGRIVAWRSFVGGTVADTQGHGTFVAGEIAAIADNGVGIAGLAPPARLIVAKVVRDDGTIPAKAEAKAIRWAVKKGARVINLSFGSIRDPADPSIDGYSAPERRAIDFAVRRGVLVVAAVGNGNDAPQQPWPYASYPAAFPHVLGVAAYGRTGAVPSFSNRDSQYVDIAAPGTDMVSLFPQPLTQHYAACSQQGYSLCGPKEYRSAGGTSFAAPQVAGAAALLLGQRPNLRPDQVSTILRTTADDANPDNGCSDCTFGPDAASGFGRLDVGAALAALHGTLPPPDRLEPNDDTGRWAATIYGNVNMRATIDSWDDPNDVYRFYLRPGQRVSALVRSSSRIDPSLYLWKPGLRSLAGARSDLRIRRSIHPPGAPERVSLRTFKGGWYSLQVKLARPGFGPYRLRLTFSKP